VAAWLLSPEYDVREYYRTYSAVARHLLASDLPKVLAAFMMDREGYFDTGHTATKWFEKFGPDPKQSWVLGLVSRWPCFETPSRSDTPDPGPPSTVSGFRFRSPTDGIGPPHEQHHCDQTEDHEATGQEPDVRHRG
jgi:hypothetical protein